ncbi:hypothetical protein [Flavobacterium selenitireducens]|uniref:hypothetical protein n=1 Tax=Flavobacterium selenitireducens TaxID=2722704 RepID=UPI00168AB2EE|nr:hypothetical protein [Flavobacterium selenitireducens]MBD3581630.1 hypothetical protein [Flavobacterium selenitireducens]
MNLLAFFETLEIGRESLSQLDENGLIRIEKQVHLQRKLNPDIDMNLANAMVSALRSDGRAFRFVLENRSLYNFFTGKIHPPNYFKPMAADANAEEVSAFIDKYLRDDLLLGIDRMLVANQYEDLDEILSENEYFPEDIRFTISRKLQGKIDFGVGRMVQKKYDGIQFLKFRTFYNCISHFSSVDTDKKINTLLDITADHYNAKKNTSFARGVMIAMSHYQTHDEELQRVLISNHAIMTSSSGKSGSGFSMNWRIVAFVVFFLIKIMVIGSKCSNDSGSNYEINNQLNEQVRNQIVEIKKNVEAKNEGFRDYLTAFDSASISELKAMDTITTGQQAFENSVSLMPESENAKKAIIENKTPYDLVLVQYVGKFMGKSCYVKKGESAQVMASTSENNLEFRMYFGTQPARFTTASDANLSGGDLLYEMRFRQLAPNAPVVLEKKFSIAKDVTVEFANDRFMIVGEGVKCDDCFPSVSNSGKRINRLN